MSGRMLKVRLWDPLLRGFHWLLAERHLSTRYNVGLLEEAQRRGHARLGLRAAEQALALEGNWKLRQLRKGFAEGRPAHVPEAPTHASLLAARAVTDSAALRACSRLDWRVASRR